MFVEMVLIQRFILYFGQPVYAASAVITSLLIFSGFGSYASSYITEKRKRFLFILSAIVLLLIIYAFALTPILQNTIDGNLATKILMVILLTPLLHFAWVFHFLRDLKNCLKSTLSNSLAMRPWAWGLNGCFSVISTALATIVGVEWGSMVVMLVAAGAYCVAGMVGRKTELFR